MKLFLADSNIFYKDCTVRVEKNIDLCEKLGFEAFHPLKSNFHASPDMTPNEMAVAIAQNNLKQLDTSDILVAELEPFRGNEVDTGVAFEIGYMTAKGKKIYAYMKDTTTTYCQRYNPKSYDEQDRVHRDELGRRIEEFGMPANLMVGANVILVQGGFEQVIAQIAKDCK